MRAVTIKNDYEVGQEFNIFLCSDIHLESPEHDRKLFLKEMNEAMSKDADILIGGDVFDMILPKDGKRYTPSRSKYEDSDDVINRAIEEAVKLLTPFAKNIKVILCGNHEDSVTKYHSMDILALTIYELNKLEGVDIAYLGYSGFIRYVFKYPKGNHLFSYDIKASHGSGGSAAVTKGIIGIQRDMTANQADCYWSGHTHTKVILPDDICGFMNIAGNVSYKSRKGIITGAYLVPVTEESTMRGDRPRSYNVQYGDKMRSHQSTGGVMLTMKLSTTGIETKITC